MNDFFVADEERIITPEFTGNDNDIETSLRPHALDEYVGQEKVKDNLKIYIEAAKQRGEEIEEAAHKKAAEILAQALEQARRINSEG